MAHSRSTPSGRRRRTPHGSRPAAPKRSRSHKTPRRSAHTRAAKHRTRPSRSRAAKHRSRRGSRISGGALTEMFSSNEQILVNRVTDLLNNIRADAHKLHKLRSLIQAQFPVLLPVEGQPPPDNSKDYITINIAINNADKEMRKVEEHINKTMATAKHILIQKEDPTSD